MKQQVYEQALKEIVRILSEARATRAADPHRELRKRGEVLKQVANIAKDALE